MSARQRSGRTSGWRRGRGLDEVAVYRAVNAEPMPLTTAERTEAVRLLTAARLSSNEVAYRLGLACRTVQRHRAAIRRGPVPQVSARQLQALRLVAEGFDSKEIGGRLGCSDKAVDGLLKRLTRKFGARNRANLVWIAVQAGLLREAPDVR